MRLPPGIRIQTLEALSGASCVWYFTNNSHTAVKGRQVHAYIPASELWSVAPTIQ